MRAYFCREAKVFLPLEYEAALQTLKTNPPVLTDINDNFREEIEEFLF